MLFYEFLDLVTSKSVNNPGCLRIKYLQSFTHVWP